jgi:hypothetical protein
VWRPFALASAWRLALAREWMVVGLRITKPSFTSFLMFCPVARNKQSNERSNEQQQDRNLFSNLHCMQHGCKACMVRRNSICTL